MSKQINCWLEFDATAGCLILENSSVIIFLR